MKRPFLSIKLRVTLWYALFALLIAGVTVLGVLSMTERAAHRHREELLLLAMSDAADAVESAGSPWLNPSAVAEHTAVTFSLYDADGALVQGRAPRFSLPLSDGEVREITDARGEALLTQDMLLPGVGGGVWLRGVASLDAARYARDESLLILQYILPALLILSCAGGYLLTRRAFLPVGRMAVRAQAVTGGGDLSARFDEGARRDELGELARAFNRMFASLQEAFERERRFTSDAAHELRTPVAVIRALSEHAAKAQSEREMRDALRAIEEKAGRMGDMLSQMLALTRLEMGREALTRETVSLSDVCLIVAEEMRGRAEEKGVSIDADAVAPDVTLLGDELLLTRVLINLLDNAIKFSPSGGTVYLSLRAEGARAVLTVRDEGVGMDEETCRRAFERFYQADASHASGGAGLGLSMARLIARLHGGDITAVSKPGKGTEMTVVL